jgi:pimeloyl-ACP methyl ester carboxylesterase
MTTQKGIIEVSGDEMDEGESVVMARSDEPVLSRVQSQDGTEIAYWTRGEGPPLLLVHGTAGVHDRFGPLLPHLEPHATVHAMDRRGRGASGDASDYKLEYEFEDVAAVIDAIAQESGSPVDVYGHSYGGNCAFGAALLTSNIRRLVLYEGWPPVKPELLSFPPEVEARLNVLIAAGDHEGTLETFMREVVMVSEADLDAIRAQPTWQAQQTRDRRIVTRAVGVACTSRWICSSWDSSSWKTSQAFMTTPMPHPTMGKTGQKNPSTLVRAQITTRNEFTRE